MADSTCDFSKNEAGKSSSIETLHRLSRATPCPLVLLDDCPRWLKKQHEISGEIDDAVPITADFTLSADEMAMVAGQFRQGVLSAPMLTAFRKYSGDLQLQLPIDHARFVIGEEGHEQLLKATIKTAVEVKAVKLAEFERVMVDATVQEKAIAHPVASAARRAGLVLKQTFAKEGKALRRKAGGYAHAKQFKRLRRTIKRQRTILGVLMREVQRKLDAQTQTVANCGRPEREPAGPKALGEPQMWLQRAEHLRTQQRHDKNKLYALHAPEVECIGKGKARKPYEFGVKVSLAVTHKQGLT